MPENITIIWGDCGEELKQYPDKHFDLVLTDPPYGIGESNEKNLTRGKLAEPTDFGHYEWDKSSPSAEIFKEMIRISKNQIIFGGNYFIEYLHNSSCWIVWDKDNGTNDFADCELALTSFKTAVRKINIMAGPMNPAIKACKPERIISPYFAK